jgi:hypothetical protein
VKDMRTVVVAGVTAVVVAGSTAASPALAGAIAGFARNADKVDGKHAVGAGASVAQRRGKLVAVARSGKLPNNIIATAPNAARLGGKGAARYVLAHRLARPGAINAASNPVHWTRLKGVPPDLVDGDGIGPRAFARVEASGIDAFSFNVVAIRLSESTTGAYCFTLDFEPSFAQVTPDVLGSADARAEGAHPYATLAPTVIANHGCPSDSNALVVFKNQTATAMPGGGFFVSFM